jgi:membrane-bound lytic murein transglycosylase D
MEYMMQINVRVLFAYSMPLIVLGLVAGCADMPLKFENESPYDGKLAQKAPHQDGFLHAETQDPFSGFPAIETGDPFAQPDTGINPEPPVNCAAEEGRVHSPPGPTIPDHPRIEDYIGFFQHEIPQTFELWLTRSTRFICMMKRIFRSEGLPEGLVYLAMIESGFNPKARSSSHAVGLWQFMEGTARKYGLRVDWWVDERLDPEKSTHAAARYLKDLYNLFGSWDLAIAAYNAGEGRLGRCLERRKTDNFWQLCRFPDLNAETKNFVPKFAAALRIGLDPQGYGFDNVDYESAWKFDHIRTSGPVDLGTLARLAETNPAEIMALNPQLRRWCTPPNTSAVVLRVPAGTGKIVEQRLAELAPQDRLFVRTHVVRAGETLGRIADRYGSNLQLIKSVNHLASVHRIRAGAKLVIPVRQPASPRKSYANGSVGAGRPIQADDLHQTIVHRVSPGETLWAISRKYGVDLSEIYQWNRLHGNRIHPGDELILLVKGS